MRLLFKEVFNYLSIYFHFVQKILLHLPCSLMHALFRLKDYHKQTKFFCDSPYSFTEINALGLTNFQVLSPLHNVSVGGCDLFHLMDCVIIYIYFEGSQPPVSKK